MVPSLSQYSQGSGTVYPIDAFPQEPSTISSNPFVTYNTCQETNHTSFGLHSPPYSEISVQTVKAVSPNFAWRQSQLPSPTSPIYTTFDDRNEAALASPFRSSPIQEHRRRPVPIRSATFPQAQHVQDPVVARSELYRCHQEDGFEWNAGSVPDLSCLLPDHTALQASQAANSPEFGLARQIRASRWMIPDATFALEQSAMDGSFSMHQTSSITQLGDENCSHGNVTSILSPSRASSSRQRINPHRIQKQLPRPHYENPLHAVKREMKINQTRQQKTKTTHDKLESAYLMMTEAEEKGISDPPDPTVMQALEKICPRLSYTEFSILGRFAEWYRGTFGRKWSMGQHIYTLALTGGGSDFFDHYDKKVLQGFVNFQVKANRAWCNDLRADPGTLCWKCLKFFGRFRRSPCDNEWHR